MGNVSGRREEMGSCGREDDEVGEDYMKCAQVSSYHAPESMIQSPPHSPRVYPSPLISTLQGEDMLSKTGIPTMIVWPYEGRQVAVEGSWDCWKTSVLLRKTGLEFTTTKVLSPGVYFYRFIVDGQWRYAPDLPHERDDLGNLFNVLDLKDSVPQETATIPATESTSSPVSSYNNSPFTFEDFDEKLPELPPLLQQPLLNRGSSSFDSLDKPLPSVLNHLNIRRRQKGQSIAAISSTHRFRSKCVTLLLYKPVKKVKA